MYLARFNMVSFSDRNEILDARMIQVGQQQVNGGAPAWEILAEPMTIHYAAVNKDGTWHEVGDRILPGKEPVCIFEKNLKRARDRDWPAADAISPKRNTRCNTSADAQESDLTGAI
jgi:hypothetical protein